MSNKLIKFYLHNRYYTTHMDEVLYNAFDMDKPQFSALRRENSDGF